ncbi:hypothetical protein C8Q76DRAFT_157348 [Earliella scabrosa]|nr:hypothetical protein C8Q76DRAFT_157348 [Earliella scabrosa]
MYREDKPTLKALVFGILVMDTFHSVVVVHICYYYLALNYLNPDSLQRMTWSASILPACTGVLGVLAQLFYARRIYLVGRKYKPVAFIAGILMFGILLMCIVDSVVSFMDPSIGTASRSPWFEPLLITAVMVVDLLLTSTFIVILHRSRSGFARTNIILDALTFCAVLASLLNTAIALAMLIGSIITLYHGNDPFTAISIPATKVYSNSVLIFLNMRRTLANPTALQNETLVFDLSMFVRHQMPNGTTNTNQSTQPPGTSSQSDTCVMNPPSIAEQPASGIATSQDTLPK